MAVGQETEVPKLAEALGQDVDEKAANKLMGTDSHGAFAIAVTVVLPLKGHLAVLELQQAVVRDGDPVRVAAQVNQHLSGTAEGTFGIDDPFGFTVSLKEVVEGLWIG